MGESGGTPRDGFFGWLFAMLAALSLFPFAFTSASAPSPAKPIAAEESDATDADAPAETTSLDDAILQSLGLPKSVKPVKPAADSKGKGKAKGKGKGKGSDEIQRNDPPAPDPLAVIAGIKSVSIEPLILCVADPKTSTVGFRFDLQIDALQKALGAHGYALDRWSLPWEKEKSPAGKPGLLVFRKSERVGCAQKLILVYLVGEWITSGIDREAFRAAVNHVGRLDPLIDPDGGKKPLPILGPMFTGSVDSLGLALGCDDKDPWQRRTPVVLNSNALKVDLPRLKALANRPNLPYGETVLGEQAMWEGLSAYLERIYGRKPKVAWLNETGTQFGLGQGDRVRDRTFYPFPTGISKVRDAYATATSGDSKQKILGGATDGTILRFPSLDKKAIDVLPRFDAGMQAPYAELALRQILLDIARNDYDIVGITATDNRDRVFLGQQVRRYAPRTQLVLLGGDLIYEHPDYRQALRGTIVASTYPMFPTNQHWSFRPGSKARHVFAIQSGYALFNAVSCARVIQQDPDAFDSDSAILTVEKKEKVTEKEKPIPFVEYGRPHDDGTVEDPSADKSQTASPPLWISVLGDQGVWPVESRTLPCDRTPSLIKVRIESSAAEGGTKDGGNPKSQDTQDTHDTHPFSLRFILLLQFVAAGLTFWAAGGFLPPRRPVAANTELPAWIRPMREWWSNRNQPGHYDAAKARRLFVPMFVGLTALWFQVVVCGAHQWALFLLNSRQSSASINAALVLSMLAGCILLGPWWRPVRIIALAALIAVVGCLAVVPLPRPGGQPTAPGGVLLLFALITSSSGMLLLRTIVDMLGRRRLWSRGMPIDESADLCRPVAASIAVVVGHTLCLLLLVGRGDVLDSWLPWLTTSSWVFNGVSPLLPVITACLGIEVLCRTELMRCWLIETSSVGTSAGKGDAEGRGAERREREKDELSYPVSGVETLALPKQGVAWLFSEARTDCEQTSASREPAPHAYLLWIGLGLFVLWLLTLFFHVRPVYPHFWINVALVSLILFGYLSWGMIFLQLLALRFRFFKQLGAFQQELDAPQSKLAAGFVATKLPQDVLLGRFLYASRDADRGDAAAFDDAASTESVAEGDLAAAAAAAGRRRAIGIKRWIGFVGAQLRITIIGLGFGAVLLFVAISSLPFQPRPWFQFTATLSFVAIGIAVVTTYVSVDANDILSRIAGTTAGKVSYDWSLLAKLAPWVLVPLVMVIGQTFPELWNWFGVALESWRGP